MLHKNPDTWKNPDFFFEIRENRETSIQNAQTVANNADSNQTAHPDEMSCWDLQICWKIEENLHNSSTVCIMPGIIPRKSCVIKDQLSHVMRKPDFCICENKGADQLRSNLKLISAFVFATISLFPKSEIFSL